MTAVPILRFVQVLLAAAITVTGLIILFNGVNPVDADQVKKEQDKRMDVRKSCIFSDGTRIGPPCYRAFCRDDGSECYEWGGACFTLDESDEDGYCG